MVTFRPSMCSTAASVRLKRWKDCAGCSAFDLQKAYWEKDSQFARRRKEDYNQQKLTNPLPKVCRRRKVPTSVAMDLVALPGNLGSLYFNSSRGYCSREIYFRRGRVSTRKYSAGDIMCNYLACRFATDPIPTMFFWGDGSNMRYLLCYLWQRHFCCHTTVDWSYGESPIMRTVF